MIKNYNSDDNEKRQNGGKDGDRMKAKMVIMNGGKNGYDK